jgi:hypothetical protein
MPRHNKERALPSDLGSRRLKEGTDDEWLQSVGDSLQELGLIALRIAERGKLPQGQTLADAVSDEWGNNPGQYSLKLKTDLKRDLGKNWADTGSKIAGWFYQIERWYRLTRGYPDAKLFVGGPITAIGFTAEGKRFFQQLLDQLPSRSAGIGGREDNHKSLERKTDLGQTQENDDRYKTNKTHFVTSDQDKDSKSNQVRNLIVLDEVRQVECDIARLQKPAVQRFQEMLSEWAGKKAMNDCDNKELVERIKQIAISTGTTLYFKDQAVSIRWNAGVFHAYSADHARRYVGSSSVLMHLEAKQISHSEIPGSEDQGPQGTVPKSNSRSGPKR